MSSIDSPAMTDCVGAHSSEVSTALQQCVAPDGSACPQFPSSTQRNKPSNGASVSVSEALLLGAAYFVSSLSGVLKNALQLPLQVSRQPIIAEIPSYRGYSDPTSATSFLEALSNCAPASELSKQEVLQRVLSISLVGSMACWFKLVGQYCAYTAEFNSKLQQEFLPVNYSSQIRREVETRTQHLDELLLEHIRAMQELYVPGDPSGSGHEQADRVLGQCLCAFAIYPRRAPFHIYYTLYIYWLYVIIVSRPLLL